MSALKDCDLHILLTGLFTISVFFLEELQGGFFDLCNLFSW